MDLWDFWEITKMASVFAEILKNNLVALAVLWSLAQKKTEKILLLKFEVWTFLFENWNQLFENWIHNLLGSWT